MKQSTFIGTSIAPVLLAIIATIMAWPAHATLLWDGNATNGTGIFKNQNLEDESGAAQNNPSTNGSSITTVSDPIYGTVWQFYKAMDDMRCEAHGATGITPTIGSSYYIGWRSKMLMPLAATLNAEFQWKAYGSPMLQNFPIWISPRNGILTLTQYNPPDAGGATTLWTNAMVTGVWIQHVLLVSVSDQNYGGYIEYWQNGVQKTFTTGTNQFWCRTFDGTSVDPKWGVYGGNVYAVTNLVSGLKIGTTYADVVDTLYCLSATPSSQITGLTGTNISYTINVVTNTGFSGNILLSVSGLPANTSYSLSPTNFSGPGTATLSVTTSNTTPQGNYTLIFRGISGGQTNYTTVQMNVAKAPMTYTWNGPGAGANNWSASGNWSPAGPPTAIDSLDFFNAGASGLAVSNINNVVDGSFGGTVASLQYGNTNGNHTTLIAAGQTLNINGDGGLLVGTETDNGSAQTVFATITGAGGTLNQFDLNASLIVRQGSGTSGSQRATLDMSGLDVVNVFAGRVLVGVAGLVARATGTLYLGKTNTIAVAGAFPQICIGDNSGNGGGANYLYLGQTNAIFADSITVGREKANGTLAFSSRFINPTAYFRAADGVSPVATWNIADNSAQSSSSSSSAGTTDFSLGSVDALVNTMNVGLGQTSTGANGSGVLTFTAGTINVNTLQIGVQSASGATSAGIGRVNVNGTSALLVVNSALTLGATSGGAGTTNTYGVLNITGGTVLAGSIAAGSGSGTNVLIVSGGTLVVTNTIGTSAMGISSVLLTNSTIQFSVASSTTNLVAVSLTTGGTSNAVNIASLPAVGSFPAQFRLIKYSGSIGGAGYNFILGTWPPGAVVYAGYLSNNAAAGSVDLVITNSTAFIRTLAWDGGASANWDTTAANWKTNAGSATAYSQGDNVVFNDAASGATSINLTTALTPASITVSNNSKTYNLSSSGKISGASGILKQGTNSLALNTANDFTGGVMIQGGTVTAGNSSALGATSGATIITNAGTLDVNGLNLGYESIIVSGAGVGANGAIINSGAQQTTALKYITLAGDTTFGGTARWDIRGNPAALLTSPPNTPYKITKAGTNQVSLVAVTNIDAALGDIDVQQGTFAIQTSTAQVGDPNKTITVFSNATLDIYALSAGPLNKRIVLQDGAAVFNESGSSAVIGMVTLTNGNGTFNIAGTALTINGVISGSGSLTKTGSANLFLSATNVYTGNTMVNTGTLVLTNNGSISSSTLITVAAGAAFNASGRSDGRLTLASGQTLNGNGTIYGSLTVGGNATVSPGGSGLLGVLTITNSVILQGTTSLKLNKSSLTNDVIQAANIAYGGTLILTNLSGTLMNGDSFKLFSASSYSGTFTNIVPVIPAVNLAWNTNNLGSGILSIVSSPTARPKISVISLNGGNLIFSGTNGVPAWPCYILSSTNASLPLNQWQRIATNAFDGNGNVQLTNTLDPSVPQQFYLLQLP